MSEVDQVSYASTLHALEAQRAAYERYRTIIDGLRLALGRPSRRVVPYLAEQLASTFADIEARWTVVLVANRSMTSDLDGARARAVRGAADAVLREARLAQASVEALGRQLAKAGGQLRRELETAFQPAGADEFDSDVRVVDQRA